MLAIQLVSSIAPECKNSPKKFGEFFCGKQGSHASEIIMSCLERRQERDRASSAFFYKFEDPLTVVSQPRDDNKGVMP